MNSASPLVSIIIPTYNRVNKVGNAIKSALEQTYTNIEIIVVDDGSTDNTQELIQTFPEVQYIKKTNGGQASARNEGLKHAKGKYIASLDSDDLWKNTFLIEMVSKLEEDNLDFVFANWEQQQNDGSYVDYLTLQYILLPPHLPKEPNLWVNLYYEDLRKTYLTGCPSPSSSLLIRSTILKKFGWNEEMKIGDDWCMLLDILFNNPQVKAAYTTEILWTKHINCENIYDGRDRIEVLDLLHIKDKSAIIKRYRHRMTPQEINVLEKEYVTNLMMVSREILVMNKDVKQSILFMVKAFFEYPLISCEIFISFMSKKLGLRNHKVLV